MGIYHLLASEFILFETSYIPISQKQALANAIKYVCNPTLAYLHRHPSVGLLCKEAVGNSFAAAKVRKKIGLYKFTGLFLQNISILHGCSSKIAQNDPKTG